MQVGTGLHLDVKVIGAGLGEVGNILFRLNDHQVNVEGLFGDGPEGLHHQGTDRDVGNEATVHDIDMNPVGTGFIHGADVLAQACEVGGEDRRGDHQGLGAHGRATVRREAVIVRSRRLEFPTDADTVASAHA